METQGGTRDTVQASLSLALSNVGQAEYASITLLRHGGRPQTIAATDEKVEKIDRLQYDLAQGPCLDALWREQVVRSVDLQAEQRWPVWVPRAMEEAHIRSTLCFQLFTLDHALGALNLFSTRPQAFDNDAINDGAALSAHIAMAVANAEKVEDLERAVASRAQIGQAVGILMERFDLDADPAFGVLVRLSQTHNVKLRVVAEDIVKRRDVVDLPRGVASELPGGLPADPTGSSHVDDHTTP